MKKNVIKIILNICYILIIICLFYMRISPTNGYESSIYSCHKYVWIILLFLVFIGLFFVGHLSLIEKGIDIYYLYLFFVMLLIVDFIILMLPSFVGYAFYSRGDECTHVGHVIDILKNGHTNETIYPIFHILVSFLVYITNIPVSQTVQLIGPIYSLIAVLYICLLSKYIFEDTHKAIFIAAISILCCLCIESNPNRLAELTSPIFVLLYLRYKCEKNFYFHILTLLFIIVFPFFHPLSSLTLIISIFLVDILLAKISIFKPNTSTSSMTKFNFSNLSLISLIILLLWFWNHQWYWNYHIGSAIRWIFNENSYVFQSHTDKVLNLFDDYGINLYEVLFKYYGSSIIYILISFIVIFNIYNQIKNNSRALNIDLMFLKKYFILSLWIIVPAFLALLLVVIPSLAGPQRMIRYIALLSPPFVGLYLLKIKRSKYKYAAIIFVIFLTLNTVLSVHPSPYIHVPTGQITHMEINGMSWFFENRIQNYTIKTIFEKQFRFGHLIIGLKETTSRNLYYKDLLPDHFGYDKYPKVGTYLNDTSYLLLGKYDEGTFINMYDSLNKYNQKDFQKVYSYDDSVLKIYSSGEFNVLLYSKR